MPTLPSINTLTAYIYLRVCEPVVSLAGVERGLPDTVTAELDHALEASEQAGLRDTSLRVCTIFISFKKSNQALSRAQFALRDPPGADSTQRD